MDRDDKTEFAQKFQLLADTFRCRLAQRTIEGYWFVLRKYPAEAVFKTIELALSESPGFPSPKALIELIHLHQSEYLKSDGRITPKLQKVVDRTNCLCGNYKDPKYLVCRMCYSRLGDKFGFLVHPPYFEAYYLAAVFQLELMGVKIITNHDY